MTKHKIPVSFICPGGGIKSVFNAGFLWQMMDPVYQSRYELVSIYGGSGGSEASAFFATGARDSLRDVLIGSLAPKSITDLGNNPDPYLLNAFVPVGPAPSPPSLPTTDQIASISQGLQQLGSIFAAKVSTATGLSQGAMQMILSLLNQVGATLTILSTPTSSQVTQFTALSDLLILIPQIITLITLLNLQNPTTPIDITFLSSLLTTLQKLKNAFATQLFGAAGFVTALTTKNSLFESFNYQYVDMAFKNISPINNLDKLYVYSSDYTTSKRVFTHGTDLKIREYIAASSSLAPVFPPVKIGDDYYIDDAYTDYIPVSEVMKDVRCRNIKVAIIVPQYALSNKQTPPNNLLNYALSLTTTSEESQSFSDGYGAPVIDPLTFSVKHMYKKNFFMYHLNPDVESALKFNSSFDINAAKILNGWNEGVAAAQSFGKTVLGL